MDRRPAAREIRPRADEGFTLVELLVALLLTALLSAGLATAVQTARRILEATERNGAASDVVAAQNFLRSSLASAYRSPVSPAHQDDLSFLGTETRLSLATGYVPKGLHQGLYRLDLALVPAGAGDGVMNLVAVERPARPIIPGALEVPPVVTHTSAVLRGIAGVRFTYFGKPSRDATTAEVWLDQWSEKDTSPTLVRLDVTFPKGDGRSWPTLLMKLEQDPE